MQASGWLSTRLLPAANAFLLSTGTQQPLVSMSTALAMATTVGSLNSCGVPAEVVRLGGVLDIGDMPFDLAAMIEPTSCCIAAADQCKTRPGDTVVVVGARSIGTVAYDCIEGPGAPR